MIQDGQKIIKEPIVPQPLCIFDDIFRSEQTAISRLAYRFLRDSHLANDVAQEVFLKFWIHLERGRIKHDNYAGWLRTVTSNLCRDQLDLMKHRAHVHIDTLPEYTNGDDRSVHTVDRHCEVVEATKRLPEHLQKPLLLTAVDGFNSKDAGRKVGISADALRKRCQLAKETVKMLIKVKQAPRSKKST